MLDLAGKQFLDGHEIQTRDVAHLGPNNHYSVLHHDLLIEFMLIQPFYLNLVHF